MSHTSRSGGKKRRPVKLCPAAEKIITEIPPYIGLTGNALRWIVKRCIKAQQAHEAKEGR